MFTNNKYHTIYKNIIYKARSRVLHGYVERHHVIPRSLGGDNSEENIVSLTAREHFICHLLLMKITSGTDKQKMTYAAWTMARTRCKKIKITSRLYEQLRLEASKIHSERQTGIKRGPMSAAHKQKIREATINRYKDPIEREKASQRQTGFKHSAETRAKLSAMRKGNNNHAIPTYGMKGKTHSPETIIRMKEAWVKRKENKNND